MKTNGTLYEKKDIKIVLLYLLYKINTPIPEKWVTEILLLNQSVDFFLINDCTESLLLLGYIDKITSENETYLKIVPRGIEAALVCKNDIPFYTRKRILAAYTQYINEIKNETHIKTKVIKLDIGYNVTCTVLEGSTIIFENTLYVGDEITAKEIENNFKENANNIFKRVLKLFLNEY